jgi:uncharacterized membrane protein
MNPEFTKYIAGIVSGYIELAAILLITLVIVILFINNIIHVAKRESESYKYWKDRAWKLLQGSLDLFVASDLLSTITIDRTLQSVVTLGILLIIRTLISWSIEVDADGCWPWQRKAFELKEKSVNINN